jgi:glycosyltransferase involved in cell wall biosynthesis
MTSAHPAEDVRIFHKECVTLANAGFQVFLVAANAQEAVVKGVQIVSANVPPSGRFSRMLNTSKAVYKKAISLDADIYHFHDPELLRFALRLKRKGKKVIYDAHEDVPKQIMGKFWINKYIRKSTAIGFRNFEDFVVKRLDYVLSATLFIRDRFSEVNTNSLDINNFPLLSELQEESDWSNKKEEICYIGGISQIRGIEQLVHAMDYTEHVKLNIAGNFSQDSFEKRLKSTDAWKQKITEFGFVSRQQTAQIMADSKIGIVTFLPLPNHIDAQPNKMFEYMSAGIPVIGSHFPLWKEIIEKNNCGICVDPENSVEIAEAINFLLRNPEKSEQMGKNGRKNILEKYNWEAEGRKLIDVYNKLSNTRSEAE